MDDEKEIIYAYNDEICFRQCSLANKINSIDFGNCTAFETTKNKYQNEKYYNCNQFGIHLHCHNHTGIELEYHKELFERPYLRCPQCNNHIQIDDLDKMLQNCLKKLNMEKFKNAELIRLDDWYIPEIKKKIKDITNYWISVDIKKDKDNDTVIVLYIGNTNSNEKAQFFIKPEKLQLSNDYKDLDPSKVISKIEVTLKDRIIKQEYENK